MEPTTFWWPHAHFTAGTRGRLSELLWHTAHGSTVAVWCVLPTASSVRWVTVCPPYHVICEVSHCMSSLLSQLWGESLRVLPTASCVRWVTACPPYRVICQVSHCVSSLPCHLWGESLCVLPTASCVRWVTVCPPYHVICEVSHCVSSLPRHLWGESLCVLPTASCVRWRRRRRMLFIWSSSRIWRLH